MGKKLIISQSIMWAAAILVVSIVDEKQFAISMLVILATVSLMNLRKGKWEILLRQLRYGGVDLNSALKRRNYGNIWNTGIRIWTNSVHSNTKTNKGLKRKRNSIIESQRRVMHQTNLLNHGGIE